MTTDPATALRHVLIVEDDQRSASLLRAIFEDIAQDISVARTAANAIELVMDSEPDLITVDIGLPDLSGIDLLHHIRTLTDAPVIFVTGKDDRDLLISALRAGADDYLVKPIHPGEMKARAGAVIRRTRQLSSGPLDHYEDAHLILYFDRPELLVDGDTIRLSKTELRLLRELVARAGRIITHGELIRRVWGWDADDGLANLHVFISGLRRRLKDCRADHRYIRTHRGIGYEFVAPS